MRLSRRRRIEKTRNCAPNDAKEPAIAARRVLTDVPSLFRALPLPQLMKSRMPLLAHCVAVGVGGSAMCPAAQVWARSGAFVRLPRAAPQCNVCSRTSVPQCPGYRKADSQCANVGVGYRRLAGPTIETAFCSSKFPTAICIAVCPSIMPHRTRARGKCQSITLSKGPCEVS